MRWRIIAIAVLISSCAIPPRPAPAEIVTSRDHDFRVVTVAGGLAHPWALAFLPDGRILVTERAGRVRVIDAGGALLPEPLAGVPDVVDSGQGGLLDIALHPGFKTNRLLYLSYAGHGPEGRPTTVVSRARLEGMGLRDLETVFVARAEAGGGRHFGSRLVFDANGYLFVSVGERGQSDWAQDPGNHAGTIVRLHDDGRVPADNPFAVSGEGLPEIWSYGHRNPQGMALHPETGALWAHEHGPRGGDEINIPRPGLNYGWPKTTYGRAYSGLPIGAGPTAPGIEPPVLHWTPSISPSGMAFYTGDRFPAWRGDIFVGALGQAHLRRVIMAGETVAGQEELLREMRWRIRDVRTGPDGYLYLLTDHSNGALLRLEPADG